MPAGTLRLDGSDDPWSTSCARYGIAADHEGALLTVAVRCTIAGLPFESQALLDTGAAWSIIGGDLAEMLGSRLGEPGQTMILLTRLGRIRGTLHPIEIVLVAERGESIAVSGSVLVAPGWTGPVVLGYRGFLERLRFALDPGAGSNDAWFFFASAGE
jgi:hypothetical protein